MRRRHTTRIGSVGCHHVVPVSWRSIHVGEEITNSPSLSLSYFRKTSHHIMQYRVVHGKCAGGSTRSSRAAVRVLAEGKKTIVSRVVVFIDRLFGNLGVNDICTLITLNCAVICNVVQLVGFTRNSFVVINTCILVLAVPTVITVKLPT